MPSPWAISYQTCHLAIDPPWPGTRFLAQIFSSYGRSWDLGIGLPRLLELTTSLGKALVPRLRLAAPCKRPDYLLLLAFPHGIMGSIGAGGCARLGRPGTTGDEASRALSGFTCTRRAPLGHRPGTDRGFIAVLLNITPAPAISFA